jgi:hypothetical protein
VEGRLSPGVLDEGEKNIPQYCIDLANGLTTLTENQRWAVAVFLAYDCLQTHEVLELDDSASAEHHRNQRTGKTSNTGHHGKLLWYKVLKRLQGKGMDVGRYERLI